MSFVRSYLEILDEIDALDSLAYAETRNQLQGAVTRLSPYISRGVITLPFIRDRLLARHRESDCAKLLQELAWREYFQNVWWAKGEAIFADLRFPRDDWRHLELVAALTNAETGIDVIDAGIKELYATGYLHNHQRMWVAALACNLAKAHWFPMGQWLYYHLMDGDLASNFLSWQWVAGTSVNKRYTLNQALIDGCSGSSQSDSWLTMPREDFLSSEPPVHFLVTESPQFVIDYPASDTISHLSGTVIHLYTPWTLDPTWRAEEAATRILVIDPAWFNRFPVAKPVLDFIVRQGQTVIPELLVWVGDPAQLPGIAGATSIHYRAHQTASDWPGTADESPRLHPAVTGYYPSFYTYWQAVEASAQ